MATVLLPRVERHARAARTAGAADAGAARGLSLAWALLLLAIAAQVYLGRFERLFDDHTIFAGVTYTDAHVTLTGMLLVSIALAPARCAAVVAGVRRARASAGSSPPCCRPLVALSRDRRGRRVRRGLHREAERARARAAVHHPQHRVHAAGLRTEPDRAARLPGRDRRWRRPIAANNQATLQNIRLWDWRVLQDTLRQLQEIRTYYDFPDIDIDRYVIDGTLRQVMLADARAERREAAREQPHLDQREADLHARLRAHDERGQRLHA